MLELMTWNEIIDSLMAEGKLDKVIIFDLKGEKLAGSPDTITTETEARGILKCLSTAVHSTIFGLLLENIKFRCMRVDKNTLIGRDQKDIFVAHQSRKVLICGFSHVKSGVSCLEEVKSFAGRLEAGVTATTDTPSLI